MSKIGLTALGAYIPYYYMNSSVIADAWGEKPGKTQRSICNSDEDAVTMAVESSMDCLRYIDKSKIQGLNMATTTGPYAEKSHATLVSTVLDLNPEINVTDYNSSLRSGTAALRNAYAHVKSELATNVLVVASDVRDAYPKSDQEKIFGDASAAFVVGTEDVFAIIDDIYSNQNEIVDLWRNSDDKYVRNAERRFAMEEGYLRSSEKAIAEILNKNNLSINDIQHFVLASPNSGFSGRLAKKINLDIEKLIQNVESEVGNSGVAQPLIGLIEALEKSVPGDRILLLGYGNGADTLLLTVTEEIKRVKEFNNIEKYLENRSEFNDYGRFLSFRNIIEANPGEDFKIPASTSQTWREQGTYLKLHASRCNECNCHAFPVQRICPKCRELDNYEIVNLSDMTTKLFTYSIDNLAGRSDDPVVVQSVMEDENGTRVYLNMTDFDSNKINIDMELEYTFRKIHNLGNFVNYYWKVRPIRRKKG